MATLAGEATISDLGLCMRTATPRSMVSPKGRERQVPVGEWRIASKGTITITPSHHHTITPHTRSPVSRLTHLRSSDLNHSAGGKRKFSLTLCVHSTHLEGLLALLSAVIGHPNGIHWLVHRADWACEEDQGDKEETIDIRERRGQSSVRHLRSLRSL